MIGSDRMARLLALRERLRDAERAREEARHRACREAARVAERARLDAGAALAELRSSGELRLDALGLLAQASRESFARERVTRDAEREAHAAHDAQRAIRRAAERDVELTRLAHARALAAEDAEAERRTLRANDDRSAAAYQRARQTNDADADRRRG